jgi:hypothetical protein
MAAGKYDDERDVAMAVEAGEGVLALCAGSKREREEPEVVVVVDDDDDDDVPAHASRLEPAGCKRVRATDEDAYRLMPVSPTLVRRVPECPPAPVKGDKPPRAWTQHVQPRKLAFNA